MHLCALTALWVSLGFLAPFVYREGLVAITGLEAELLLEAGLFVADHTF